MTPDRTQFEPGTNLHTLESQAARARVAHEQNPYLASQNAERERRRSERLAEASAAYESGGWPALNAYWQQRTAPALREIAAAIPAEAYEQQRQQIGYQQRS